MTKDRGPRRVSLPAIALAALLAACGGGSSDETPPVPTGPSGTLDATFGIGGIVLTTPSAPTAANAIVLQPDRKIVVAGSIGEGAAKSFYVSRYKPDGTLDASFGSGGIVTTVFDPVAGSEALAVVLQADGKIVAVGGSAGACALARYNADGALDPGFGTGGIVQSRSARDNVECPGVALQVDGKIVTVVNRPFGDLPFRNGSVMRFNPDGGRDLSFAVTGEADVNCPLLNAGECRTSSIVVRKDGKLVVSGVRFFEFTRGGLRYYFAAQFADDGTLDRTFGDGGYSTVLQIFSDCDQGGLALQSDGRIVAVNGCFPAIRMDTDGGLDAGFGVSGRAPDPDPKPNRGLSGMAVALQADGKIVIAAENGERLPDNTVLLSAALIRYDAAGMPDRGFGQSGVAVVPIAGSPVPNAVAILPDGRIVVAGNVTPGSGPQGIFVARFFGDPVAPSSH